MNTSHKHKQKEMQKNIINVITIIYTSKIFLLDSYTNLEKILFLKAKNNHCKRLVRGSYLWIGGGSRDESS